MSHNLRLGPIALFLTVIAAVVATLAMLTFATSRADAALAERFAAVTSIRGELEKEGSRFLQEAEKTLQEGAGELPEGAVLTDSGNWKYYLEKDGYALTVEVAAEDGTAAPYTIENWKITKLWEGDDPFEDLWPG